MKTLLHVWKKFQTYRPIVKPARRTRVRPSLRFPSLRASAWSSRGPLLPHRAVLMIVSAQSLTSELQTSRASVPNDFLSHLLRTEPSPHTSAARWSSAESGADFWSFISTGPGCPSFVRWQRGPRRAGLSSACWVTRRPSVCGMPAPFTRLWWLPPAFSLAKLSFPLVVKKQSLGGILKLIKYPVPNKLLPDGFSSH